MELPSTIELSGLPFASDGVVVVLVSHGWKLPPTKSFSTALTEGRRARLGQEAGEALLLEVEEGEADAALVELASPEQCEAFLSVNGHGEGRQRVVDGAAEGVACGPTAASTQSAGCW